MNVDSSDRVRVVTIGGGTGSSVLLRGLKRYADRIDITAILTTFDDGGSSGRLRDEFGVPALGDLRRCIAALLPEDAEDSAVEVMLEHRFSSGGLMDGHSLGNLMLLGAMQRRGSLSDAIDSIASSLNLAGRVVPVSDEPSHLCGELEDGTVIQGESAIGERNEELFGASRISLDPPVSANPDALTAIRNADVVVLGPGDLFASVIPNLLPDGVIEAISQTSCRIIQVCNIAMKAGEADTYAASDFVKSVNRYLRKGDKRVDAILVNKLELRTTQGIRPVECDDEVRVLVDNVLARRVSDETNPRRHDSNKLAAAVMEYVEAAIERR
ncbi:MAG: YvcK family protein [Chloroflexi bacterium]|nr:YvcK family protein [Chloroflexota bacterium]MYF79296.1 YvcK family protein [Chloroflexota bacterium]MYK61899.1 YvcK family protein [Chloroflexota bacterium]